jgi:site-specific DNA-cytosine methylase
MKLRDFIKQPIVESDFKNKIMNKLKKPADDYIAKKKALQDLQNDPHTHKDVELKKELIRRKAELERTKETQTNERMPATVIQSKQRYAKMTDKELANRFKDSDEQTLRQMAWRHGYGKMSSHYWDRVQKGKAQTEDGVQPADMKRVGAVGKTVYVHKDGKTIMIPAEREKEFIQKGYKKSALRTEETNESEMRMDKSAFVKMLADKIKEPQKGHGRPEYDNRLLAKMYKLITGQEVDFEGNKFTINVRKPQTETAVGEGASMIPYYKTEKDWDGEKRVVWEFPKTWANDKELDTPYMSNASMRQFLTALGYPADFEDMSAVPIDEFIGVSTQWLKKNIGKQSPEEEPTVDKNPGGPTMISGGRPEGYMNQQVKLHNELARKIKTKYPEVTHLGFN